MKKLLSFLLLLDGLTLHGNTIVSPSAFLADTLTKKTTVLITGELLSLEELPQGAPAIRFLENKKVIRKNVHYYSIQVNEANGKGKRWFICSDSSFSNTLKDNPLPLKVTLFGDVYKDDRIPGNKSEPLIIIRKITLAKP